MSGEFIRVSFFIDATEEAVMCHAVSDGITGRKPVCSILIEDETPAEAGLKRPITNSFLSGSVLEMHVVPDAARDDEASAVYLQSSQDCRTT